MARILVIEDNADNLELMVYLLEAFGHAVTTAVDGAGGLAAAASERPEVILSSPYVRARQTAEAICKAGGLAGGAKPTIIDERARSFSGGQRQRLVLARALLADPEILVLVEPTSAVDAHTEARIARDLREARRGRTTVVVTTSPLVLDQADRVVLVSDGRVVAEGAHRELLRTREDYRDTVTRGESE